MAVVVSFNFPVNADAVRQRDALCGRNGYQATIQNPDGPGTIPNPESKEAFAKRMTREWWATETRKWEAQEADRIYKASLADIVVTD